MVLRKLYEDGQLDSTSNGLTGKDYGRPRPLLPDGWDISRNLTVLTCVIDLHAWRLDRKTLGKLFNFEMFCP